jgi:hypothetical protein
MTSLRSLLAPHTEFLLILAGAHVFAAGVSAFFLHPFFISALLLPGLIGGACARVWGWWGIAGFIALALLLGVCGFILIPFLLPIGTPAIAIALLTRRADATATT